MVSATGKATLTLGGSAVKKVKHGFYKLTVVLHSKKGFVIQALGYHAMSYPKAGSRTLTLIPHKYFFQAAGGPKTYFTVT